VYNNALVFTVYRSLVSRLLYIMFYYNYEFCFQGRDKILIGISKPYVHDSYKNSTHLSLALEVCWLRLIYIKQGLFFIITENSSGSKFYSSLVAVEPGNRYYGGR
jgi:hypothetical protein